MTITTVKKGFQAKQFNSLIFQTADTGTEGKTNKMSEETDSWNWRMHSYVFLQLLAIGRLL